MTLTLKGFSKLLFSGWRLYRAYRFFVSLVGIVLQNTALSDIQKQTTIAIAWCLAWGKGEASQYPDVTEEMRQVLLNNQPLPDSAQPFLDQVQQLVQLPFPSTRSELETLVRDHSDQWKTQIGLVYGGATKIKQYVFEAAKLPDIRGASALLDRINLEDIPGFFGHPDASTHSADWLDEHFPGLKAGLIPELLVYFKGGSVLAFCPSAWVDRLADAIEKRYTHETLTANSCAVGATFRPLELQFGLLQDSVEHTFWLDQLQPGWKNNAAVRAYFGLPEPKGQDGKPTNPDLEAAFRNRKNFNELVGKLATQFNLRRSGFDQATERPSRRYPPMLETHPYLRRDDSDRSSAVFQITDNPSQPWVSEPLARKRRIGQITKQESAEEQRWYKKSGLPWDAEAFDDWVSRFKCNLPDDSHYFQKLTSEKLKLDDIQEARSLKEISAASDGFVAYIYADGNNMGQHIRNQIKTPQDYQQFSEDIFEATEQSVYHALAHHLKPHHYTPDAQSNRLNKAPIWLHPFEIVTIGGDDVLLIVPANKALEIAKTIGDKFEEILVGKGRYSIQSSPPPPPQKPVRQKGGDLIHRYKSDQAPASNCCLSISSGVLITADTTPIYYADKLVSQLLKTAKKGAKELKEKGYFGGTVDFLTLKAVTMISSNIEAFRKEGLTIHRTGQQLKLYAAPYTLHELGGLLATAKALKKAKFPRSQLYQIRSLLERGKRTAILNYRYFRVRLDQDKQALLQADFESAWCEAETNNGNLAPWLTAKQEKDHTIYETLWRELVELYPFVDEPDSDPSDASGSVESEEVMQ